MKRLFELYDSRTHSSQSKLEMTAQEADAANEAQRLLGSSLRWIAVNPSAPAVPDFTVRDEGTIFILTPNTEAGRTWADEHLPEDATRWVNGYVVEHRYISDIVDGIRIDGLTVEE